MVGLAAKTVCVSGAATYLAQVIPGVPVAGEVGTFALLVSAVGWLVKALAAANKQRTDDAAAFQTMLAEKEKQFLARLDAKDKQIEAKGEQIIVMTGKVTEVMTLAMEAVKESRATDTQVISAIEEMREMRDRRK